MATETEMILVTIKHVPDHPNPTAIRRRCVHVVQRGRYLSASRYSFDAKTLMETRASRSGNLHSHRLEPIDQKTEHPS